MSPRHLISADTDPSVRARLTSSGSPPKHDLDIAWTPSTPWHRLFHVLKHALAPSKPGRQPNHAFPTTVPWDATSLRHALTGDFARILTPPAAPIPWDPAIPESDLAVARRHLREAWSIEPSALVIAALGNTTTSTGCDAFRSVYALSLARTAGLEFVSVLPRSARQLRRASRFHHQTSPDARLLIVDELHASLPAIDLAVWAGPGFGPMHTPPITPAIAANPILQCWRHAVPVIAPHWAVGYWLQHITPSESTPTTSLTQDATLPELVSTLLSAADPKTLLSLREKALDFCHHHAAPYAAWYKHALTGQGPGTYQSDPPPRP